MAIETRQPVQNVGQPPSAARPARTGKLRLLMSPAVITVLVWVVTLPAAFLGPRLADLNPFDNRAWAMVLAVAFVGVLLVLGLALWRGASAALASLAAGLMATWFAFTLRTILQATPFGFGGLLDDAGRQTAMATRYSVTAVASDAWIPGLPAEYPPLYFWLTGRAAAMLDKPAWQLMGKAEVLTMSAAVIVGFLLWRRLLPPWVALAVVGLTLVAFGDPRKPYEVITLVAFLPWALATFARPPRGRLHWLPAGLIGGLILVTYQAWFAFGAVGVLAIIVGTWRGATDRRRYLYHVVAVAGVATATAAWYLVPFLWAMVTRETAAVSDLYAPSSLLGEMFPFLVATPLGVLQLVGLGGLLWLRRSVWWATPLLLLAGSAYLYRVLATARYAMTGHTTFLHYTVRLYAVALVVAGVLVVVHATARIVRRFEAVPARGAMAAALAVAVAWTGYTYSQQWMPGAGAPTAHYSVEAHTEPLPGGGYPRYAPAANRAQWLPVDQIEEFVERTTGPDPREVTLSVDERLFAYLPWPGYTTVSRMASGGLTRWDRREAEIKHLTTVSDPTAFAGASAHTAFGPIDIFVLKRVNGAWMWRNQRFLPSQFDRAAWSVNHNLPEDIVVAVRR